MIDTVYKVLQAILNKEQRGHVTPTEFNLMAKQVQEKIFREYFTDENRDKNRENRGLVNKGFSNLPKNQRERIGQFVKSGTISISSGIYALPTDLYFIGDDSVTISATGKVVEEMDIHSTGYTSLSIAAPTATYPVYEYYENGIKVLPATVTGDLNIKYVKLPSDPNWTYTVVSGKELFDVSNGSYQDFELHPSEFSNIVMEMASLFGINLREAEVTAYAEQIKNNQTVQDNN